MSLSGLFTAGQSSRLKSALSKAQPFFQHVKGVDVEWCLSVKRFGQRKDAGQVKFCPIKDLFTQEDRFWRSIGDHLAPAMTTIRDA